MDSEQTLYYFYALASKSVILTRHSIKEIERAGKIDTDFLRSQFEKFTQLLRDKQEKNALELRRALYGGHHV